MKIFLFLILLSLSCKSIQDSKPIENLEDKALIKKWIVTPDSGLNLRDAPSRKAKSIQLLPRGTMVTHKQLPENEKIDTIEDQKGKWLKVEVGNESGWVFDVYLSEPVFSPSGDKFYFTTYKHPQTEKILKGFCGQLYREIESQCSTEIRNAKTSKVINIVSDKEEIANWYDNENIISYWGYGEAGFAISYTQLINIRHLGKKNLYMAEEGECEDFQFKWICIWDKCFKFINLKNMMDVIFYSHEQKMSACSGNSLNGIRIRKIPIRHYDSLKIKYFSDEQILKLKHPYTGNIEFSVDKRNYLLHVPTGKITEVK